MKYLEKTRGILAGFVASRFFLAIMAAALAVAALLPACNSDEVGDSYTTFTGERLGEYLRNRPAQFSEFVKMLDTTEVMGLLNAYGSYTCFAPTNDALARFYQSKGRQSLKQFPIDSIKIIVYNHLFKGASLETTDFPDGDWSDFLLTMGKRTISTNFTVGDNGKIVIMVNGVSPIVEENIEVHNGMVHVLDGVVQPTDKTLVEVIEEDPDYKLFYNALVETGLYKQLQQVEDKTYDPNKYAFVSNGGYRTIGGITSYMTVPQNRYYGYTVLMESDATFAANGVNTLDDMKKLAAQIYDVVFPEDKAVTDITNRRNSFNRFVAYHLINKRLSKSKFVESYYLPIPQSIKTKDMFEYVEPICPSSLMEVRTIYTMGEYCAINYNSTTGKYISIIDKDNDALNGYYHGINGILAFDYNVASEIASKRLRLDVASFFPEFTNNSMRGRGEGTNYATRYIIPPGYCDRLSINEGTELQYMTSNSGPGAFQGDEINCIVISSYDITITTPVIPKGTYEVRLGYQPNGNRGVVQVYWDGKPTGIPLDLRIDASDPRVGYGANGDNEAGYENDKMMRNRGYMKGPASSMSGSWYNSSITLRESSSNLRRVLGLYNFTTTTNHTLRVKAVKAGQFQLDFVELVPTEVLEQEDIN